VVALAVDVDLRDETGAAGDLLELARRVAEQAVAAEGLSGRYELAVTLVEDARIRELNREHRHKDDVTDVLSFPLVDEDTAAFVLPGDAPTHLGDVVIALGRMREQAAEYGHSIERELAYLTVHGVLHLMGYDHEDDEEKVQMRTREEEILADLPR
jgi:probable rRNA maturation factor